MSVRWSPIVQALRAAEASLEAPSSPAPARVRKPKKRRRK